MPRAHDLRPEAFKVNFDPTNQLTTDPGLGVSVDALGRVLGAVAQMISSLCEAAADNPFIQGLLGIGADALTTAGKIFAGLQAVLDGLCGLFTDGSLPDGLLSGGPESGASPQTFLGGLAAIIGLLLDNPIVEGLRDLVEGTGNIIHDIVAGAIHLLNTLGNLLGAALNPTAILEFFQNAVDWLWNLFASGTGAVGKTVSDLIEAITSVIGSFLGSFGDGTVLDDVVGFIQSIVHMLGDVTGINGIVEFLQNSIDNLWNLCTCGETASGKTLSDLIDGFVNGVASFLSSFGDGTVLGDVLGLLTSLLGMLGIGPASVQGVIDFLQDTINCLWSMLSGGAEAVGKTITDVIERFTDLFGSVLNLVGDVLHIDDIVEFFQDSLTCLWAFLTGDEAGAAKSFHDVVEAFNALIGGFLGKFGVSTTIHNVIDFVGRVLGIFGDFLHIDDIVEFLQDTVDCIWRIVTSSAEGIGKTLQDVFTGFGTLVTNFLESFGSGTVFADIVGMLQSLVSLIGDVLHIDDIVEFFQNAVDWLWNLFTGGAGAVGKTIHDLVEGISDTVGAFLGAFGDGTLMTDVISFVQSVLGMLGDLLHIDDIVEFLQNSINWLWNLFTGGDGETGKTLSDLIEGISTAVGGFLGAFGDGTIFTEVVQFFQSLWSMLGLDDLTPGNILKFIQQKVDNLWAIFTGITGSIGHSVFELVELVINWFEHLPFIKKIVAAFVPGGTELSDIATWAGKVLDINSWLPAGNLIGQISHDVMAIIPISHVGVSPGNLLTKGGFTVADAIAAGAGWSWDGTQNNSGTGGSVKVVCDGTTKRLYSNVVRVSEGQKMDVSVFIKWSGLSPTTGDHIGVQIQKFLDGESLGYETILTKTAPGASGGWSGLQDIDWPIPLGVDAIRMVLWTDATAGTIWWDDAYFGKTGLGAALDSITDIFHQGADSSPFTPGSLLDDLWMSVFGHQATVTGTSAKNLDLLNQLAHVSGGAIAADDFERTSTTNLGPSIWEQTYTTAHGKLATPNGHDASWDGDTAGGSNFCMCRYLGGAGSAATSSSIYQRVSLVLGSAPQRGVNGTAFNDVVARLNPARNYFVRARWGGNGVLEIHKYVNGVQTQLTNISGVPTSAEVNVPNAGTTLTLDAGDIRTSEPWKFTAYQDGAPVLTAYDLAHTSKAEAGYLGWGFAVEAQPGFPLGQVTPGKMFYWTACDQGGGSSVDAAVITGEIATDSIPDITAAMSTDLQSTIDNVVGSFTGGSTGAVPADITTRLTSLFYTLFGYTTPQNQLQPVAMPATVIRAGVNACLSPDFEDSLITRSLTGGGVTGGYSTTEKYGGSRSYKITVGATTADRGVYLSTVAGGVSEANFATSTRINISQAWFLETWVYAPVGNVNSPAIKIVATIYDDSGHSSTTTVASVTPTKGVWTQLNGVFNIPNNQRWTYMYVSVQYGSGAATNDVYYLDNATVRHETFAQAVIDNLHQAVNGGSTTGNAPSTIKSNLQTLNTNLFGTSTTGTTLASSAIATGGISNTHLAAGAVTSTKIATAGVTGAHIASSAVGSSHIAAAAVGSTQIATNGVTGAHIAANAVGSTQIATNGVTGAHIASSAVGSSHIASGAVGATALAAAGITGGKIASNAVGSTHIVANGVTGAHIATNAVGSAQIANGAVGSSQIATNGVTGAHIANNAVGAAQIILSQLTKSNITDLGKVYDAHVDAIGSGATMVRTSTGTVNMTTNGGAVALPASLFNSNVVTSADITASLTDGKFTVSLEGWYYCELCIMVNLTIATALWKCCPVLLSNGPTGNRYGNDAQSQNSATWAPRWIKSSFEVYLQAGNYVRAGYDAVNSSGTVSNFFTGEASGAQCYFSISLSNRSLA